MWCVSPEKPTKYGIFRLFQAFGPIFFGPVSHC